MMEKITYEVVRSGLYAIAREMKIAMMRTAASPIIHSGGDASAAVFDANMQLVAQGNDIPTMLGSAVISTRVSVEAVGRHNLRPGDVIISNDVYLGGGNHQPDVQFTRPVFLDGDIIAFTMTRGHWVDIGGSVPGSFTPVTWDIFGEGVRIPPVLLYRDDKLVKDVLTLIINNTRDPESRLLDIKAQYAGTFVGEQRVIAMVKKYGKANVHAAMAQSLDYSEHLMRTKIGQMPDGVYEASDFIEPPTMPDQPYELIPIRVKITILGDEVTVDFTGTAAQVRGGVNCPLSVTCNCTWFTFKAIADPQIPINQGCYRPIKIIAPEGSLLNCVYPASVVGGNGPTSLRVVDLLLKALAPAMPLRVIGQSYDSSCIATFSGNDPEEDRCRSLGRRNVSLFELHAGGMGARPDKDGVNAVRVYVTNAGTQPVEQIESNTPLTIEEWSIVPDSGGAGRWRGGNASRRVYRVGYDEATLTVLGERGQVAPDGVFGGLPGALMSNTVSRAQGGTQALPAKGVQVLVHKDDRVTIQPAGSGGYGVPQDRPAELVLNDFTNGYVTAQAVHEIYGVVLTGDQRSVDNQATAVRRNHMRKCVATH